jgi:ribonuclease J
VQVGALDGVVRDRIRMALNGHMTVTVLMDEQDEPLGDPWVDTMGLPEMGISKSELTEIVEHDLSQWLGRAKPATLRDDKALDDGLRRAARQSAQNEIGKKPEVTVVVSRLS